MIIEYIKAIMQKDPLAGRELIKLNEKHIKDEIEVMEKKKKKNA